MKSAWKRALSLLLAAAMLLSLGAAGWAADGGDDEIVIVGPEEAVADEARQETAAEGTELSLEVLDPSTLGVRKLGEEEERRTDIVLVEPEDGLSARDFDPDELVRVSIFLEEPAALDRGCAMQGVGSNPTAIACRAELQAAQDALIALIADETGHVPEVCWNLTLAVNAVSAWVRAGDLDAIREMAGVRAVERETRYLPPSEESALPNTANTSENMVGAAAAWAAGYTGAGSRIAVIDTGLDTAHQSFAAEPFTYSVGLAGATNELMTKAQVQALASQLNSKSGNYVSAKIPYGYNYVDRNTTIDHLSDTQGEHGSHVAGIAAANRYIGSGHSDAAATVGAVGMAPDAQLFIMKVFGSKGGAYDSDYMVAIEDAIVLDCDAVNLSLGSAMQGTTFSGQYQNILNSLADRAHNEGLVVSISAGNSYDFAKLTPPGELYKDDVYYHTGGSPGTYVNSLCVAAAQNTLTTGTPMEFNGSLSVYYAESTEGSDGTSYSNPKLTTIVGSYSYVYIDATGTAADFSAVNSAISLSGKVVIVNRGEISFSEKGNNAKSFSPKALIVANNTDGVIHMDLSDFSGSFPMVSITLKDVGLIKDGAEERTAGGITCYTGSMKVTNTQQSVITDRSEATITDFSSWGVPGSLIMKPEITAPGGDIYSVNGAHKTSGGSAGGSDQYELMSGTSMAAPHITGLSAVAAEYLREHPVAGRNAALADAYSTRAIIQSLLMSTATPMRPEGEYLSVLQQGAGLADVGRAVSAPSVLMMSGEGDTLTVRTGAIADGKVKAELGDDPGREGVYSFGFTLYNLTDRDLSYELHTDLFTQKTDGTYSLRGTSTLPGGGVSYTWNGSASAPSAEHDVNLDGWTDDNDAQAILDYLAFLIEGEDLDLEAADMDGDGEISTYDAHLLLNWTPEGGAPAGDYVLAAHGTAEVVVTICLTAAQRSFLEERFPRGAYLEGFTYVSCADATREGESLAHEHSIPILGFYGSWTGPSMFDNMSYIDGLYGAGREAYSGNSDTNCLMLNDKGANFRFSGNPYAVEEEFPADRLALSSRTNLVRISYNLVRAAGTTGFAVTRLDDEGGVSEVLNASVVANDVPGMYYSSSAGWQNTGTKLYSINKTVASYGLTEGDRFRVGFYAIPEYNGMLTNGSYDASGAGALRQSGFSSLLRSNTLGAGALVGYDFTVDDTEPVIVSASLSGSTLSVQASDDRNLAYVAVLSLDGSVKYAEAVPGSGSYGISFDASDAIANAAGYVAVFAGDYAGNETARAIRVNDRSYEEKTVYVLSDSLSAGGKYLIVSRGSAGSGYALGHSGTTVASSELSVNAGVEATGNKVYIDSADVPATSIWTAASGVTLKNGNYYLGCSGTFSYSLAISTSSRNWSYSNSRLSVRPGVSTYYLRYNNGFSISTSQSSIYLYQQTVIRTPVDPDTVSGVKVTPSSLDLYRGNTADLAAQVTPITAADRTVTWSSSNSSVASVDQNGHVTAVGAGSAVITATANGAQGVSASCTVTVTSVNKTLNAVVWDVDGSAFFSSFNANGLPAWSKLHSSALGVELVNAYMADGSTLYASTLDPSSTSVLYKVNRSSYALTEFGTNYIPAFGMARSPSSYSDYYVYGFAMYLILGNLTPVTNDEAGGTFSGLPYGLLDLSETEVGGAYVCGVCAKSISSSSASYYFLDETGKIWQVDLSRSLLSGFSFGTPSLVVDTGIGTSFLYQSLYYDGTYLYWSHQADNTAELIVVDPDGGKVYHAGDFGDGVWPAAGLYVNGSAAPASVEEDEPAALDLQPVATREELLTEEICRRMGMAAPGTDEPDGAAEIIDLAEDEGESATEIVEIEPVGMLNAVRAALPQRTDSELESGEGEIAVTVREDSASTNGYITVVYDPEILTLKTDETGSGLEHFALYPDEEKGLITFVYASKNALPAGTELLTAVFRAACEDSTITVETYERGSEIGIGGEYEEIPAGGTGHSWPEQPEWAWEVDHSAATATFVCQNDPAHVEELKATIAVRSSEPDCEHEGQIVYTAFVDFGGKRYEDSQTVTIPATGHVWGSPVWTWAEDCQSAAVTFTCSLNPAHTVTFDAEMKNVEDPEADCEHEGLMHYTALYTLDGVVYTDSREIPTPALGHDWGEVSYVWADDNGSVTATRTCGRDGSHVETETVNTTSAVTTPASCEAAGERTYTATFTNPAFAAQTKTVPIPATGHDWNAPTYVWSEDNATVTATRTCNNGEHPETETVNTTSAVTTPASCEAAGERTYTATFTNPAFAAQTKTVPIPATGHDWGEVSYVWADDNGSVTATRTCGRDGSHVETETVNTTSAVTTPASCESAGERTYTATFTNPAFATQTKTVPIPATGHDWNAPTYVWSEDNATVTATRTCKNGEHPETETVSTSYEVVTEPTTETEGLGRYTATFANPAFAAQTKEVPIAKLDYRVTITDYTKGAAACSIDPAARYRGELAFTVTAARAVLVAVKDGEGYAVLPCATADGAHGFTLDVAADTELVLVFRGDVDLNGAVESRDGNMVSRCMVEAYEITDPLALLAADVDGNGKVESRDGNMISRSAVGKYTILW